jgi:hypothetical protein
MLLRLAATWDPHLSGALTKTLIEDAEVGLLADAPPGLTRPLGTAEVLGALAVPKEAPCIGGTVTLEDS